MLKKIFDPSECHQAHFGLLSTVYFRIESQNHVSFTQRQTKHYHIS